MRSLLCHLLLVLGGGVAGSHPHPDLLRKECLELLDFSFFRASQLFGYSVLCNIVYLAQGYHKVLLYISRKGLQGRYVDAVDPVLQLLLLG